jgi:CHAD domain-containing protein
MKAKWQASLNTAENARAVLPALAEKYFKSGRKAADGKRSPKELHRFRVATKRFRYALELFRPVYGPTLDRRLKALRELQDSLGKVSDYYTIRQVLSSEGALDARLARTIKKKAREFRSGWKALDSDGQLKHWKAYLARAGSLSSKRVASRSKAATQAGN